MSKSAPVEIFLRRTDRLSAEPYAAQKQQEADVAKTDALARKYLTRVSGVIFEDVPDTFTEEVVHSIKDWESICRCPFGCPDRKKNTGTRHPETYCVKKKSNRMKD